MNQPEKRPQRNPETIRTAVADQAQNVSQRWLPRFGIAEMMLATMIFCVMAAAGSYLRTAIQNDRGRPIFVIFTLASPVALVLVLSAYRGLKRWLRGQ